MPSSWLYETIGPGYPVPGYTKPTVLVRYYHGLHFRGVLITRIYPTKDPSRANRLLTCSDRLSSRFTHHPARVVCFNTKTHIQRCLVRTKHLELSIATPYWYGSLRALPGTKTGQSHIYKVSGLMSQLMKTKFIRLLNFNKELNLKRIFI